MKKYANVIIWGIISIIIVSVINYITLLFDFNLMSYYFLFIIPLGSILYGVIVGCMLTSKIKKNQIMQSGSLLLLVALFGFLLVPLSIIIDYGTLYLDYNYELNHLFRGEHISYFTLDDKPMNIVRAANMVD